MRSRSMLCPWVPKTGSEDTTDLFCTPVIADNIKFGDVRLNAVRATESLELFPDYWRLWAAEIRLWVLVVIVSFSTNPSNSSSSVLNRKRKLETLETWDEHSCTWEFITWVQEISLKLSAEQCIVLRFLSTGLEDLIPSDNHNGKVFFPELFSSRVFTEGSSLSSDHHLYTSHHLKLQLRESPQEDCEYS